MLRLYNYFAKVFSQEVILYQRVKSSYVPVLQVSAVGTLKSQ